MKATVAYTEYNLPGLAEEIADLIASDARARACQSREDAEEEFGCSDSVKYRVTVTVEPL